MSQQGAKKKQERNKQRKVLMSSDTKTNQEFIPMVLLLSTMIQQVEFSGQPLLCLLDSGATSSWIAKRKLPKGVVISTVPTVSNQTMAGMFSSKEQGEVRGVVFPEFFCTQKWVTYGHECFTWNAVTI